MKLTPLRFIGFVAAGFFSMFLLFQYVHADTIFYQQPIHTDVINSSNSPAIGLGTGLSGVLTEIQIWVRNSTNVNGNVTLGCYTDSAYSIQCPQSEPLGSFRSITLDSGTYFTLDTTTGGKSVSLPFSSATTSSALLLNANRYYRLTVSNGGTGTLSLYGTTTPNTCANAGCTGSAYMYVFGAIQQSSQIATTSRIIEQITPGNGVTTSSAVVTFQWSWFNSGYELYDTAQAEISDITAGFQYTPQQSNAALSGYGTTTQIYTLTANHLHLWRACLYNPASGNKTCSPYRSLNVVGASASSSVPVFSDVTDTTASSTIAGSIWGFLNVGSLLQTKLPFAYFYQISDLFNELQSTSTSSFEPVLFDYESLSLSTTTKNSLPAQWEAFSTTTIGQYIPSNVLASWRLLMQSVLWFGFASYVYFAIQRMFAGNTHTV